MTSTLLPHFYEVRPELILAIATAILALATGWMAMETRRMARAAMKTLQLEQMPILGVRNLKVEVGKQLGNEEAMLAFIRIGMELFNAGRVPVKYQMKSFRVTFADRTADSGQFLSRGGKVLPGGSTTFFHPGLRLDPPVSTFPAKGRIRFEYDYSDELGRQPHSIMEIIEYTLSGATPGAPMTWLYVDEPSAP